MKLGISTYSLTWSIGVEGYNMPLNPLSIDGLIRKAAKNGLNLVQIADNAPLHTLECIELEKILRTAEEMDVTIEVGTRGTEPDHLLKYLDIAKRFNSTLVRTLITTEDIVEAEKDLKEVITSYEKSGISIAIENHGLHTTNQLVQLFKNINNLHLGCCLDTVNSFGALECPQRVIDTLLPYTINLHIKDFDIRRVKHQMGYEILGTPAGHGRLDIKGLFKKLHELGKDPTVILELWTPYMGNTESTVQLEEEWFNKSLDFLKRSCALSTVKGMII